MEILENEDAPAKPEIDKDGKLRMGGNAIVLSLKGKVPKATNLKLRAGAVDVSLKNFKGADVELDIDTSSAVTLTDLDVKEIKAEATSGKISARGLKAVTRIRLEATSGDIVGETLDAPGIEVDSTSGSVRLKSIPSGTLNVDCTSGNVELIDCAGDELKVDVTSGDVTLLKVKYPRRSVKTTSGKVTEK